MCIYEIDYISTVDGKERTFYLKVTTDMEIDHDTCQKLLDSCFGLNKCKVRRYDCYTNYKKFRVSIFVEDFKYSQSVYIEAYYIYLPDNWKLRRSTIEDLEVQMGGVILGITELDEL